AAATEAGPGGGSADGEFVRPIPVLAAGEADAFASAAAVHQVGENSDDVTSDVENYGDLNAYADSYAKANDADSFAQAAGVVQEFSEDEVATGVLNNYDGATINAEAVSVADGDAIADSYAAGYLAIVDTGDEGVSDFVLDV